MKRLLFFPGHRIIAYEWERDRFRRMAAFEPDDEGRAAFSAWLAEAPRKPVQMLVDVIEEEFHADQVPHALGRERAHLYQRTAERHFRNNEFRYIASQGRERGGRRDDRVLVAGLTNPDLLQVWLNVIAEAKVPLKGIHSLPLVGESLLARLDLQRSPRVLLVSQQVPSTLRQSYYERGQLRFSRLVPGRYEDEREYAEFVATEISQTLRFLENQRFRERGHAVETVIIADGASHAALQERLAEVPRTAQCRLLTLDDVAARLGLRERPADAWADTLFAQVLLRCWRTPNHYGVARLRRYFFDQRARIGLRVVAAAAVVAALAVAGGTWMRGALFEAGAEAAREREARFQQLYEQRLSQLDEFEFRAVDVKNAVDLLNDLRRVARTDPARELDTVGRVLADYPAIRLDELAWTLAPGAQQGQRSGAIPAAGGLDAEGAAPSVRIAGQIDGFDGDYRAAIERFDGFVADLRGRDLGRVRVSAAPFDLGPDADVSGDSGVEASGVDPQRADFELRIDFDAMEDGNG